MQNDNMEIQKLYDELYNAPFESGFLSEFNDLDIEIDLYKAYIMGYVSSFLKGVKISDKNIEIDDKLSTQLENCIKRLLRLQTEKNKIDSLAQLIKEKANDS